MKKILLTSIVGLMTLVPNVSSAEEILDSSLAQSYAPFKAALEEGLKKHSEIDKTKFLSMLEGIVDQTYHVDTGDTWLSTLVAPCVGSVSEDNKTEDNTGKNDKYEICKNFITDVYEANNRIYNDLTNNLYEYFEKTATYMEPTGDIVARDTVGKYFVSTIKYPKNGLKELPYTVKNQKAVFSTENQFVCLLGYENTCKQIPLISTTAFVLAKSGPAYLVEVNREQYDANFSGMGLSWDRIPAYVEAVKSLDFLDEDARDKAVEVVDKLEAFAQGAVTSYKFEDQVQLCIDDIRQEHKGRLAYSGVSYVTDDMINVKVNSHSSCTLDSCSLTVEALGSTYEYNCVPRDKIPAAKK